MVKTKNETRKTGQYRADVAYKNSIKSRLRKIWPMFAKGTCLFVRIVVCGNLYNSNLMTAVYS